MNADKHNAECQAAYNDVLDRKPPQQRSNQAYMNAYRFWFQTLPEAERELI